MLAGGATDSNPSGTGVTNISDTVNLPAGGSITYTVTGTVNSTAVGQLKNTATITPTIGSPLSATDTDNLAGLEIIKSDSAGGTSNLQTGTSSPAGTTGSTAVDDSVTYTIIVSNVGPGFVNGATISDAFPAGYAETSWTSVASGGATRHDVQQHGGHEHRRYGRPAFRQLDHVHDQRYDRGSPTAVEHGHRHAAGRHCHFRDRHRQCGDRSKFRWCRRQSHPDGKFGGCGRRHLDSPGDGRFDHTLRVNEAAAVDVALTGHGRHSWQSAPARTPSTTVIPLRSPIRLY